MRGELRIAGTDEPLLEALRIRLRSGDLARTDTVTSAADGSFRSQVAFPRGILLAQVLYPNGEPAGECEQFFDPGSDETWFASLRWPNFLRARLLDRARAPLANTPFALRTLPRDSEPITGRNTSSSPRAVMGESRSRTPATRVRSKA